MTTEIVQTVFIKKKKSVRIRGKYNFINLKTKIITRGHIKNNSRCIDYNMNVILF